MIDTHSHLYASQFEEDIQEVVERAKAAGLTKILLPNINIESIEQLNKLVEQEPQFFYRMIGLHPCSVEDNYKDVLATIKEELNAKPCIAVGEIGVDLYWDKSTQKIQEEAFLIQCEWAIESNLPIVIHSRESIDLIIDLIKENLPNGIRGVFHCFTGTLEQAQTIIDMGMYLGIGGVVTFKNSNLRDVLKDVSLDRIIIETDSPYLAPVPYRGKRNESSYITEVVKELSKIYDLSSEEIDKITTENAQKLFDL